MLSIVTTTYNSGKHIERLFQSLRNQGNTRFEWIIVDDCSVDETVSVVSSFEPPGEMELSVYRLPFNSGGNIAGAIGVLKSQYEFLVRIDHDDELLPNAVSKILTMGEALKSDPSIVGIVFPSVRSDTGDQIRSLKAGEKFRYTSFSRRERSSLDGMVLLRGDVARNFYALDERALVILGGLNMIQLSKYGYFQFSGGEPILIYHRDNPQSITTRVRISNKLVYTYAKILDSHNADFYLQPIRWARHTFALIAFSKLVHQSYSYPLKLFERKSTKLFYMGLVPFGVVLTSLRKKANEVINYPVVTPRNALQLVQRIK